MVPADSVDTEAAVKSRPGEEGEYSLLLDAGHQSGCSRAAVRGRRNNEVLQLARHQNRKVSRWWLPTWH